MSLPCHPALMLISRDLTQCALLDRKATTWTLPWSGVLTSSPSRHRGSVAQLGLRSVLSRSAWIDARCSEASLRFRMAKLYSCDGTSFARRKTLGCLWFSSIIRSHYRPFRFPPSAALRVPSSKGYWPRPRPHQGRLSCKHLNTSRLAFLLCLL